jgi:hypothetical protein
MSFVPPAAHDVQCPDRQARLSHGPISPPETAAADADLRSFIFEVSAAQPAGVADATEVPDFDAAASASRPPHRRGLRIKRADAKEDPAPSSSDSPLQSPDSPIVTRDVTPNRKERAGSVSSRRPTAHAPREPIALSSSENNPKAIAAPRAHSSKRRPKQQALPICTASFGLHAFVIALLAAVGIAVADRPEEILLTVGPPPVEELLLTDVDFEATETSDHHTTIADDIPSDLIDPGIAAFGELETTAALADVSVTGEPTVAAGALGGDLGALFGQNGAGLAEFDNGLGGAPTAKFFGSEIEGRRIVFVLDNSGSMQGGRLETVIAELLRCVDSLRDDQEFYVIFHSDMVYPMLYPDPVDRYLRPTPANRRLLAEWLDTVELCLGDAVEEALAAAAMIEPDTVFLLSDGRIQGDKKIRFLLDGSSRNFPVHTFAVGMNSSVAGRRNLQQIADANGGKFNESEIPPEMRDLSRERLRPYHNETPGPVWGRNVKPFKFGR